MLEHGRSTSRSRARFRTDPDVFEIDALLPAQFDAIFRVPVHRTAEQRLVLGVLAMALQDAVRVIPAGTPVGRAAEWATERDDARAWILERGDAPFQFTYCCHAVGFDPDALRDACRRRFAARVADAPPVLPRQAVRGIRTQVSAAGVV